MKRERLTPSDRTKTFVADESDSFELPYEKSAAAEETILLPETTNRTESATEDGVTPPIANETCENADAASGKTRPFGRYALLELLGSGGMGEVHRALHVRLRKQVAIKVLREHRAEDEQAQQRFNREVRLMCGLEHPNLVRLETAGLQDGVPYVVMEYVAGIDLQRLLKRVGPLKSADACQLTGQAAVGLSHLHQRRIIHRDVKPSNLIVTPSSVVKLVDLGMARLSNSQQELTPGDKVVGNAHYIAPESIDPDGDDRAPDACSDVYCLGCTLFTLLAGHPPFQSNEPDLTDVLQAKLHCQPPRLDEFRSDLPVGLADIVAGMIARNPLDRIATPMQVVALLAPLAVGCDIPELLRGADASRPDLHEQATDMDTAEYLRRCAEDSGEMNRLRSQRSRPQRMLLGAAMLATAAVLLGGWLSGVFSPSSTVSSLSTDGEPAAKTRQPPTPAIDADRAVGAPLVEPTPPSTLTQPKPDLLASVDAERDAFDLSVRRTASGYLLSNLRGVGMLQVPMRMPAVYTLDLTVERMAGEGTFGIGFSAGHGRMIALLDRKIDDQLQSGLFYAAAGRDTGIHDPHEQSLLPADTPVQIRLKVTPGRVELLRRSADGGEDGAEYVRISTWYESHDFAATEQSTDGGEASVTPYLGGYDAYYPHALFLRAFKGSFRVSDIAVNDFDFGPTPQPFAGFDSTSERRLAEWIVWRGGHVKITTDDGDKTVKVLKDLTDDPWLIEVDNCLSAPGLRIGDTTLLQLSKIKGIQKLSLVGSDVTSEGLAAIAGMKDLRVLSLSGPNLDTSVLKSLQDLPQLRLLQLFSMQLTHESLAELERFPQLTMFCLTGSPVTDDDVDSVIKWLPNLQHFCLSRTKISGSCLASLTALRDLEQLQLTGTQVGDDEIAALAQLPKLKLLGLAKTNVSESAIETLREKRPELQVQP